MVKPKFIFRHTGFVNNFVKIFPRSAFDDARKYLYKFMFVFGKKAHARVDVVIKFNMYMATTEIQPKIAAKLTFLKIVDIIIISESINSISNKLQIKIKIRFSKGDILIIFEPLNTEIIYAVDIFKPIIET